MEQNINAKTSGTEKAFGGTVTANTGIDGRQSSSKQFILTVFILSLATNMFLLPIYLIQSAGRDGYIVLSIVAVFELVILALILAVMKLSPDTDFFELLTRTFGKVAAKIIVALFAAFLFFKLAVSATETLTFYTDNVFADFDMSIMTVLLLVFLAAVASHTLRALARLNELITPLILAGIAVLITIVIATGFDLANILPAVREPDGFKYALAHHLAWLGDYAPLMLFIGRTHVKKHTVAFSAASGAVGMAIVVFFGVVMCAAFGNVPLLADSSTNISSVLQFSLGNVYGRIDVFSSVLWSVAEFVETALFFYAVCRCVEFVIGRNAHVAVAIAMCAALYVVLVFVCTDPMVFSVIVSSLASSVISVVFSLGMPVTALITALVQRRRNGKADGDPPEKETVGKPSDKEPAPQTAKGVESEEN